MKLVNAERLNVVPKDRIAAALSQVPAHLVIDLSNALRLMGGSAANGDNNDALILQGETELGFRRLIARFGFDRLPLTYGEAQGLLDYCERLDTASGIGMLEQSQLPEWQKASIQVFARHHPDKLAALKLLCAGDMAGLRQLHQAANTLTQLGKSFREFSEDE